MNSIAKRFTAAAATYDQCAGVQKQVAQRLLEFIPEGLNPLRILEIGCGTGLLTAGLRRQFPGSQLVALDLAPAMIARARNNLPDPAICWIADDIRNLTDGVRYQLLVSSSALHWIQPFAEGITALHRHMDQAGHVCCAVMLTETLMELHSLKSRLFPHKPPAVTLPGIAEVKQAFAAAGMNIKSMHIDQMRFFYPSAANMLQELHHQGVTGTPRHPLSRRELQRLIADYDKEYKDNRGVYANYQVAWLHAESACRVGLIGY